MATETSLEQLIPRLEIWLSDLYVKNIWTIQDQKLVNLISSCFCIADKQSVISKIKPEILARNTQYLAKNPALLDRLHGDIGSSDYTEDKTHQTKHQLNQISETANKFFNRTRSINDYINSNPKIQSIAIVGNGPNLLTVENGENIDNADLVIRFNNVVINENSTNNTGRKTNIWMINPGYNIDKSTNLPSDVIWLSSYYPFFRPNSYWRDIDNCNFKEHYYSDHSHWHKLVKLLKAPPSAGLLCITSLVETECELHAFGFSGLGKKTSSYPTDDSNAQTANNRQVNHYGDNHKKSDRHNWSLESAILNELQDRVSFH